MNTSLLILSGLCLIATAFLVGAEAALAQTSPSRIELLEDVAFKKRDRVLRLLKDPEALLNPLRLVVVMLQVTEVTIVTVLAYEWLGWPGLIGPALLNAVVLFIVTEVGPRTLGILHADRLAVALAGPISGLVGSYPIRLVSRALIGFTNWLVPGKGLRKGPFSTPGEFIALADAALEDAVIEKDERDLIESVIEFGATIVREVMVPRTDMTTVQREVAVDEALEICSAAGFSRLPVVGDGTDDIVGLIYMKDLIRAELDDRGRDRSDEHLRVARFVPETKSVSTLLKEMQQESFHLAMAVDEYGGIAGLVTLEDLIEELVGEIVDEYDKEEPLMVRQTDGSLRVDGRMLIDELNDLGTITLPEGDFDTVGGLVFDLFGRVPLVGETAEVDGYRLRVDRVHGRRITRVHVARIVEQLAEGEK